MSLSQPEKSIYFYDPIVQLANKGVLTPKLFSSMLQKGQIASINIDNLVNTNLLTPDQLIIWFASYLIPDTRDRQYFRPGSTIVEALWSQELVNGLTPDHLGKLVTINEKLHQRGLYGCDLSEYEAISHKLNMIRIDKGLEISNVQYAKMPTTRRLR